MDDGSSYFRCVGDVVVIFSGCGTSRRRIFWMSETGLPLDISSCFLGVSMVAVIFLSLTKSVVVWLRDCVFVSLCVHVIV